VRPAAESTNLSRTQSPERSIEGDVWFGHRRRSRVRVSACGSVITAGSDAARLLMEGVHLRVTTIPTVLLVVRQFELREPGAGESLPEGWVEVERKSLGDLRPSSPKN
jgi:hypothetical protein